MLVRFLTVCGLALLCCNVAHAQLFVDFNSTTQDGGPHNDTLGGWQAYDAGHEVEDDLGILSVTRTKSFAAFGTTIDVTPDWTNSSDIRVRQMIDRGAGNDATWLDGQTSDLAAGTLGLDFVTDFIGIDTRTGGLGNGAWDGVTGTPTYMTLALGNLVAGDYSWTSYHHDTENVYGPFAVWSSTDGGANFTQLADGMMTDGTLGGTPSGSDGNLVTTAAEMLAAGSIYSTNFTADGTNDVVMRFAPYSTTDVHNAIWGMNGFSVTAATAVPEPGSVSLLLFGLGAVCVRRRKK